MKELTIEQKAQRYDEALERYKAKQEYESQKVHEFIEYLFPELKESEDERIRKHLKAVVKEYDMWAERGLDMNDVLAWLEKQGEQKPDEVEPKFKVGQIIREKGSYKTFTIEAIKEHYYELSDHCVCEFKHQDKWELVNQKSDNKVEPKFHKDEWVTNGDYTWKIVEVKPLDYILQSQDGNIVDNTISHVDEQFHSFTIRDARAGDVLVRNNCTFIFMGIKNGIVQALEKYLLGNGKPVCFGEPNNDGDYHPATKEQRDALVKAMADAGYTFDFDKKELKKIEQKTNTDFSDLRTWKYIVDAVWTEKESIGQYLDSPFTEEVAKKLQKRFGNIEHKPALNEEDSYMLGQAIKCVNNSGKLDVSTEEIEDWLKSLKDRYTWKPSEEQMKAVKLARSFVVDDFDEHPTLSEILIELEEQLKKLKS